MAGKWTYIGWRGSKFITHNAHPKASSLKRWIGATFRLARPTEVMPSAAHDKQNPTSVHREGRALDVYPVDDAEGWKIAHTIADYPDGGDVDLILWKDYQWGGVRGPGWRYTGRTDHDTHLHIETRP